MKITKKQLARLIREEMQTLSYDQKTISAEEAESAELAKEKAEDIVPVEDAWDGGPNLVHPIDFEDLSVDDKVTHGQEIMQVVEGKIRISARNLRRIIKEEKSKLLKEYGAMSKEVMNPMVAFAQAWSGLGDAIQEQMIDLINAHVEGRLEDAAYEINPNAFDRAVERLTTPLRMMDGEDADDLRDMMEQVQAMMRDMR